MSDQIESQHQKDQSLSRRELLKALAATAGATAAAAFLPGNWVKPVVTAGVLPAHAQGTIQLDLECGLYDDGQLLSSPLPGGTFTYDVCAAVIPLTPGVAIKVVVSSGVPPTPPAFESQFGMVTGPSGNVCAPFTRTYLPGEVVVFDFSIPGQTATCQVQFDVERSPG